MPTQPGLVSDSGGVHARLHRQQDPRYLVHCLRWAALARTECRAWRWRAVKILEILRAVRYDKICKRSLVFSRPDRWVMTEKGDEILTLDEVAEFQGR